MNFEIPLSLGSLLLPAVCTGVLLAGFILFVYMSFMYRSAIYTSISIMGFVGLGFVGSEMMITFLGGFLHLQQISLQFHRIEQIAAAFVLFSFVLVLVYMLELSPKWKTVNKFVAGFGLLTAVIITVIAYVNPDAFVSMTIHKPTYLKMETDYGRGQEGFVYQIRDLFLALTVIYMLICMLTDLIWHKKIKNLILPVIGIVISMYGAFIDVFYVYQGFNPDPFPHTLFSRFSVGITVFIVLCMTTYARRFIESSKKLDLAYETISISEEKYRLLIEGTEDCIFTLDKELRFKTANRSALKNLQISLDKLKTHNLYETLYATEDQKLTEQIVHGKVKELMETGRPVEMKVQLKSFAAIEPKDFSLRLEMVSANNEVEIVGKASAVLADKLSPYFHSEKQKYIIGNYLTTVEDMSLRLVQNLNKYLPMSEVTSLRMALMEILVNAIEHGNLKITFDEKTAAMMEGDYLEFLSERRQNPLYKDKTVSVEYSITPEAAAYKITDDGDGFDYQKIVSRIKNEVNQEFLPHGRGIMITWQFFDDVKFNAKGNQVLLIKKLTGAAETGAK